jgi:hypothetical protein
MGNRMTMLWNTQIRQMRGKEREEDRGKKEQPKGKEKMRKEDNEKEEPKEMRWEGWRRKKEN